MCYFVTPVQKCSVEIGWRELWDWSANINPLATKLTSLMILSHPHSLCVSVFLYLSCLWPQSIFWTPRTIHVYLDVTEVSCQRPHILGHNVSGLTLNCAMPHPEEPWPHTTSPKRNLSHSCTIAQTWINASPSVRLSVSHSAFSLLSLFLPVFFAVHPLF